MVRTAGNTSPWEDSTMLTSVTRFNAGITYESLLVPAGYGTFGPKREESSPTSNQRVLKQRITSSGRVYNFDEFQKLEEQEEEFLEILQAYQTTTKRAGNIAALPPAKEPRKMLILHQGVLVFIPSTHPHLEQMKVKEVGEHMLPLLFIQKEKPNLWVTGSSFQVSDPSFQVPDLSFTQGATRINNSYQHARGKGDSRRGDESSNDVQKTLRVAHPRGSR
ncbi:hypothetical protein F2Q69_00005857 [Brassica cretica]|uniref:Uncharacterized protein n=1 Tax=Brassica cretica TaxID=69181 RepID=A0A8S9PG95_BRACR|nr:hypothetical protein F2Q69_00005857 [Brassica cretica]